MTTPIQPIIEENKYFVKYRNFVDDQLKSPYTDEVSNALLGSLNKLSKDIDTMCNDKISKMSSSSSKYIKDAFDNIDKYLYGEDGIKEKLEEFLTNNSISNMVGTACTSLSATLLQLINLFKGAIALVNRFIKSLIDIVEKAVRELQNLIFIIDNCIMNALNRVMDLLTQITNSAINTVLKAFDWDGLRLALENCPALTCWLEDLFSKYIGKPVCEFLKQESSEQRVSASDLVECIKQYIRQYGDLSELGLIESYRDIVQDLINGLNEAKKAIKRQIKNLFRDYFTFLYRKRKASDPLMSSHMFELYAMYYCDTTDRMSLIDVIKVLEGLSICLASLCATFSKKAQQGVKEIKEKLLLSTSSWNLIIEWGQTYFSALGDSRSPEQIRAQFISKKTDTDLLEIMVQKMDKINQNIESTKQSRIPGYEPTQGQLEYMSGVESLLSKFYRTLGMDILRYEPVYRELSIEDSLYKKTVLNEVKSNIENSFPIRDARSQYSTTKSYVSVGKIIENFKQIEKDDFSNEITKYNMLEVNKYIEIYNKI